MSRQQIGGAVGAIVGGVVAYFATSGTATGQGVQYGYLIGPAVGELEAFEPESDAFSGPSELARSEAAA